MRLQNYLIESKYDVVRRGREHGYFDITITFKVPDRWGEFDTTNKNAGLHLSLSEYEYREEGKYWNFGYSLIAETKSGNTMVSSGDKAKKYYPLSTEREYIKDVLYEATRDFIVDSKRKNNIPIIIRGPLDDFRVGLERYHHITDIIKSCGYSNIYNISIGGYNFIIQSDTIIDNVNFIIPDIKKRWKV